MKNINNEELKQKIKLALPENWEFDCIFDDCDSKYAVSFRVKCPIEDRMGDTKLYHKKVNQICQATNSIHDGADGPSAEVSMIIFSMSRETDKELLEMP